MNRQGERKDNRIRIEWCSQRNSEIECDGGV